MTANEPEESGGILAAWSRMPLYLRILVGLVLGVVTGLLLGERATSLDVPARLVLRVLGALAPAIVLGRLVPRSL